MMCWLKQFPQSKMKDRSGVTLNITECLFKGTAKIRTNNRHSYMILLPQSIIAPQRVTEFDKKGLLRRSYYKKIKINGKDEHLVSFFMKRKGRWIGQSTYQINSKAKEVIRVGGIDAYLQKRVFNSTKRETVKIIYKSKR